MEYMDRFNRLKDERKYIQHIFETNGDADTTGNYTGKLFENHSEIISFPDLKDNYINGLKLMRLACAEYLKSRGYSGDYKILHYCIKPERDVPKNTLEVWTVDQLFVGRLK